MKIGFFADGPWAHRAFDNLLADNHFQVSFVVPRYENQDSYLKAKSFEHDIPFLTAKNVNSPDFINDLKAFKAELFVSLSFDQIIKEPLRQSAPKGFINCHAGALPFYRGRNVLNWAIINGESQFGVTVHYVDAGIDTGDIIVQDFVLIEASDTYETVLKKAHEQCPITLLKALKLIYKNKVERIPQNSIHPLGFYCSRRKPGDEWINWQSNSKQIHNFIRGIGLPGPCGRTILNGNSEWAILSSELIEMSPEYIDVPGRIVGKDPTGVYVKTEDTVIKLKKVDRIEQDGQIAKAHQIPNWPIGAQLSSQGNQK